MSKKVIGLIVIGLIVIGGVKVYEKNDTPGYISNAQDGLINYPDATIYSNDVQYDNERAIGMYFVVDNEEIKDLSFEILGIESLSPMHTGDPITTAMQEDMNIIEEFYIENSRFPEEDEVSLTTVDYSKVKECYDGIKMPNYEVHYGKN